MSESKKRSLAQNRYRWSCVVGTVLQAMNQELEQKGCEYRLKPEDVDLFIKENALGIVHRIKTSIGEFIITGKLKTRSKRDFEEAMEQIRAYFAQLDNPIYIKLPNEFELEQYKDNLERV